MLQRSPTSRASTPGGHCSSYGADAVDAELLIFGRSGFDDELAVAARRRGDVELIDLDRIRFGA